jgi:hypothetical protein
MKTILALFLYGSIVLSAGSFGFEAGMSKDQVLRLVGQSAVKEVDGDRLVLTTAPTPHASFEYYVLWVSPERGLVKVGALGKNIKTSRYGDEITSAFTEIQNSITKGYGTPKTWDYLKAGSTWNEPQDWMTGLEKKERVLASYWKFTTSPNHIDNIMLEAMAQSLEEGYLMLTYEFDGFDKYHAGKKTEAGKVF